jgi:hypothetical protein
MNDIQRPEEKIEADGNQRVIAPDQKDIDRLLENLGHIRSQNAAALHLAIGFQPVALPLRLLVYR